MQHQHQIVVALAFYYLGLSFIKNSNPNDKRTYAQKYQGLSMYFPSSISGWSRLLKRHIFYLSNYLRHIIAKEIFRHPLLTSSILLL